MTPAESIAFALAYCAVGTLFSALYALWMGWKWPGLPIDATDRTVITILGLVWPMSIVAAAAIVTVRFIFLADWTPIRPLINLAHRKGAEWRRMP